MNQTVKLALASGTAALLLSGCVHLESVSTTSVPVERSNEVSAESSKFLFLRMSGDNDFTSEVSEDLAKQCPTGRVEGILTKFETITYVPLFAHTIRVSANGYCVEAK